MPIHVVVAGALSHKLSPTDSLFMHHKRRAVSIYTLAGR